MLFIESTGTDRFEKHNDQQQRSSEDPLMQWEKIMTGHKGFTLIEIMIALFLLTTALIGLVSVTTMVMKGNAFSKTSTTATTLAKDKIEELEGTTYDNLPAATTLDYWTAQGTALPSSTGAYFARSWSAPGTDTKTITVTVNWPSNRSVVLRTIRAKD